ncbi:MAG: hypothetical protein A2857_03245 [Candidatus Levybacteria bacterium RIFCSPHIGHO2_01_FULL_36_15]|nr:MAG: hypothetical protein A2857_03245 [Candidatus Levybacteria bacterium RIFCSPHIGHO2_01_FULL_36_15]
MSRKLKNFYHLLEAIAANIIYGFPSRNIFIIGVTGTDGKTTTTSIIYHILKESGKKVAMISTVGAAIGNKTYDVGFHVTTPSSFGLQKYIKQAMDLGNKYLVLETTSHAIDQYRIFGIKFSMAVLTNITHEHLDYHKTYENYVKTKSKLLESAKIAIVNRDDESYQHFDSKFKIQNAKLQLKNQKWVTYGMKENADINPDNFPFKTNLIGKFNKYNCLAAIAVCRELGINDDSIRKAILSFKAPIGRQEIIYNKDYIVMIDFAHTPNAFEEILPEARKIAKKRLIHVFGSAGLRDATKRPLMGKASAEYSDIIVLTAEDPRTESVEDINKQILEGISNSKFLISNEFSNPNLKIQKNKKYVFKIPDRKKAIEFAISIAQKGDLVICTGKSHEKSMNYGKGEESWDEFGVSRQAIKSKASLS